MNCDRIRDLMDDLAAGRLAPTVAAEAEAHLAGCAECHADLEAARFLAPRVAELPRSLPPRRPLWTGIAGRLRPGRSRLPVLRRLLPLAAAVALVAFAGLRALRRVEPPAAAAVPAPVARQLAAYDAAMAELEATAFADPSRLPAGIAASARRDLAELDAAIAETAAALATDPGNEALRALALSAHRRKLAVLRQVVSLALEG